MMTSSKRAYATPRSAAARAPAPVAGSFWPVPPQEMLKHSKAGLVSLCGISWSHKVLFEPSEYLWQVWGLILDKILPLLPSCWGFSFALGHGVSFLVGSNIVLSMAVHSELYFGVLTGEVQHMFFYSSILSLWIINLLSKVMPQILQARLQQYMNQELPDVQVVLEKAEEPEIKLPTSAGSLKKQESSRKTSISALLTMPKPLTVWITINCG